SAALEDDVHGTRAQLGIRDGELRPAVAPARVDQQVHALAGRHDALAGIPIYQRPVERLDRTVDGRLRSGDERHRLGALDVDHGAGILTAERAVGCAAPRDARYRIGPT